MKYYKKYLLIKKLSDNTPSGVMKIEKDGKIIINYNLSVFYFIVDIFIFRNDTLINTIYNQSINGIIKLMDEYNCEYKFIFVNNNDYYYCGNINDNNYYEVKKYYSNELINVVNLISEKIFNSHMNLKKLDIIKEKLNEIIKFGEKFNIVNINSNFNWVKVEYENNINVIGCKYDLYGDIEFFALGKRINTINDKKSYYDELNNVYDITFYDRLCLKVANINFINSSS